LNSDLVLSGRHSGEGRKFVLAFRDDTCELVLGFVAPENVTEIYNDEKIEIELNNFGTCALKK
jgi:hypothetical protein